VQRFFSFLGAALLVSTISSHAEEPGAELHAKAAKLIQTQMAKKKIPGLSVAIVEEGKLVWTKGFGYSDLENQVAATSKTVYRFASVSKALTATAAMKLVEEGKLDLDKPVKDYVSQWPEKKWTITTRQLLSHLGGVRHYRLLEINNTKHYHELKQGLSIFAADPLLHEPGAKFAYSTYGFTLAGCALESAAEMNFMLLLQKLILDPAGMNNTQEDSVSRVIPNRAQGYRLGVSGILRNSNLANTSYKIPGGGLCGTASDLGRFAIALMEGSLLSEASRMAMWTTARTAEGMATHYGLGWRISSTKGLQEVAHGGAQQRVSTYLYLCPKRAFAIALLCNLERSDPGSLVESLARLYLDR
jgi:CubicO group peptidase (beta-lactamase class C family)